MLKIVLLATAAIVAWLVLTQPGTSAPIIAEIVKNVATFLQVVLTALLKLLQDSATDIQNGS